MSIISECVKALKESTMIDNIIVFPYDDVVFLVDRNDMIMAFDKQFDSLKGHICYILNKINGNVEFKVAACH